MRWTIGITIISCVLVVSGCAETHNQTSLLPTGEIAVVTSTASSSMITPEGAQSAVQHGLGPSVLKQDSEGNWINMPGPIGVLTYNAMTSQFFAGSPKDVIMEGIEFTPAPVPGQPAFKAAKISMNLSGPLKEHVSPLLAALESLQGMTLVEAEGRIEQMRIAGEITPDIAAALIQLLPLLL